MPPSTSAAFTSRYCDVGHLVKSLGGNRLAARKLAQLFLAMYPGKIVRLDAALHGADWGALRREIHELRGSCAIFSASTCLALAGQLEKALPDHVDQNLPEICAHFKDSLAHVAEELRRFLDA